MNIRLDSRGFYLEVPKRSLYFNTVQLRLTTYTNSINDCNTSLGGGTEPIATPNLLFS